MEFRAEIERLRGVAIVIVVLSHTLVMTANTTSGLPVLSALRGATWIYIFVAGYLMAHLRHRYTYRGYLDSKLKNVIAPHILIVSLVIMTGLARLPEAGLAAHYLTGHTASTPLWFVPMIALFYLAFPLYDWLCSKPRVILGCAVLACIGSVWMGRPDASGFPIDEFAYFQSAYLCGMAWNVKRDKLDVLARQYIVPLILIAIVAAALSVGPFELIRHAQFLSMAALTTLLMITLQDASPMDKVWYWLAPKSFGIFFLHGLITDRLIVFEGKAHVGYALVIGFAIVGGCGFVVQAGQRVFGRRSRYLLGS